jgi:hypothetical protein
MVETTVVEAAEVDEMKETKAKEEVVVVAKAVAEHEAVAEAGDNKFRDAEGLDLLLALS